MNIFDVLIWLLLIYAAYRGWKRGIFTQISGIIGIVLGAWVASNFSHQLAEWFEIESIDNEIVIFIIIVLVVMVGVTLLAKFLNKILHWGGLSFPIRLLGAAFSIVKFFFFISLLLSCYLRVSPMIGKAGEQKNIIEKSFFYEPLLNVSGFVFPYILQGLEAGKKEYNQFEKENSIDPNSEELNPNEPDSLSTPQSPDSLDQKSKIQLKSI